MHVDTSVIELIGNSPLLRLGAQRVVTMIPDSSQGDLSKGIYQFFTTQD